MIVDTIAPEPVLTQSHGTREGLPAVSCGGISWHCFHTAPNLERHADAALKKLGFETYLPLEGRPVRGKPTLILPIFPRYLFARFDARSASWGRDAILSASDRDLGRFILNPASRLPAVVPEGVVGLLRSKCAANGVIYPAPPRQMHRKDRGRIVAGPWREFIGICSRTNKERVWLLLNLFGRETEVEFKRDAVDIVES
jgi:Transcription termination factor nusG